MRKVIEFTKLRWVMLVISLVVIAGGIAGTIALGGFNLGIDFQAGLSQRVTIGGAPGTVTAEDVRETLAPIGSVQVQTLGDPANQEFMIRIRDTGEIEDFSTVMARRILESLRSEYVSVAELETAYVGPRLSGDLTQQVFLLTTVALALILIYIWFRFRLAYAVSSIAALVHDVLVMLGFIGLAQIEVSTATIAAVLTIIGYSLNDTIVIFDRIRENEGIMRDSSMELIVNTSITQSLSRTLITSLTTLLAVLAIFIFTTGSIRDFALNLIVGIAVGTYSSVFVASPILLAWRGKSRKQGKKAAAAEKAGPSNVVDIRTGAQEEQKGPAPDAGAVLQELGKKRSGGKSGKNVSRKQRKKKK
jgi:preprotein translocase subunit SecF